MRLIFSIGLVVLTTFCFNSFAATIDKKSMGPLYAQDLIDSQIAPNTAVKYSSQVEFFLNAADCYYGKLKHTAYIAQGNLAIYLSNPGHSNVAKPEGVCYLSSYDGKQARTCPLTPSFFKFLETPKMLKAMEVFEKQHRLLPAMMELQQLSQTCWRQSPISLDTLQELLRTKKVS